MEDVSKDITDFYPRLRQMMIDWIMKNHTEFSRRKLREWGYLKYKCLAWYS